MTENLLIRLGNRCSIRLSYVPRTDQGRCELARRSLHALHRIWRDKADAFLQSDILYLRRDLLRRYLRQTRQKLLWVIWGERLPTSEEYDRLRDDDVSAVRMGHEDTYRHVEFWRGPKP